MDSEILNMFCEHIKQNMETFMEDHTVVVEHFEKIIRFKQSHPPKLNEFMKAVCELNNADVLLIGTKTRKREVVYSRQLCMHYLKINTRMSLHKIGDIFSKDHATVMHAFKTINDLSDVNKMNRLDVSHVKKIGDLLIKYAI